MDTTKIDVKASKKLLANVEQMDAVDVTVYGDSHSTRRYEALVSLFETQAVEFEYIGDMDDSGTFQGRIGRVWCVTPADHGRARFFNCQATA